MVESKDRIQQVADRKPLAGPVHPHPRQAGRGAEPPGSCGLLRGDGHRPLHRLLRAIEVGGWVGGERLALQAEQFRKIEALSAPFEPRERRLDRGVGKSSRPARSCPSAREVRNHMTGIL